MQTRMQKRQWRMLAAAILPMALLAAAAWKDQKPWRAEAAGRSAGAGQAAAATGVTHVAITDTVVQPVVERLGMNMGEESYFDSSMLLKNLVARNPGFEGGSYQTILRCLHADVTRCADDDTESVWPQDFWRGAAYEWITGPLEGHKGSVGGSSAAVHGSAGAVLQLGGAMAAVPRAAAGPAYLVVRKAMPGDATAGWWPQTQGGATMTTEFHDLSPHTAGKQALRMSAAGAGESATLIAYFDTMEGRTFLRMHGKYRLSFRAKAVSGSGVRVEIERISQPAARFMAQEVPLAGQWQDLHVDLTAKDAVNADGTPAIGPVKLAFAAVNATVLLDDVRLEAVAGEAVNKTVFRDEVVDALRAYHPGVLRFMASSTGLGSSVANMLAAPEARVRAGYSPWQAEQTDVGYGLPDFLQLCATIHADPWVVVPAGASVREMRELVEYLAATWSGKFGRIHLELGNETWNGAYKGESIEYPEDYGHRVAVMFRAARQSKGFDAKKFDLIAGGQAAWAGRNKDILMHADGAMDSMAIAPYLLHDVPAGASTDAIFGALFAEAEQMSAGGQIAQNIAAVKPAALEIYETNLHTTEGSPTQATLNAVVPSIGAGVAVVSEMLQAMRAGVRSQAMFTLGQWSYKRNDGLQVPLWGTVVDMGVTNRRRPQFLAGALVNTAAHGVMVGTQQSGENPVWNESSGIDGVSLQNAHALQSFAFRDGAKRAVVLINLSRSAALAVDFTGAVQPVGRVDVREMTAAKITDSNEDAERVKVTSSGMVFKPGQRVVVPAFSVMVLKWSAGR